MKNVPIGQLLIENKLITQEQLDRALELQRGSKGKMLGDIIIELGFVSEEQFARALATRLQVPFADLGVTPISIEAVRKIPEAIARKYNVLAINVSGNKLTIATNDPVNFYIFEEIKAISGMDYYPVLAAKTAIRNTIDKVYSMSNLDTVVKDVNNEYIIGDELTTLDEDSLSGDRIESAPVVKLVNTILESAYRNGASDIHIEPFREKTKIRTRIDGDLMEQMEVSAAIHASLVTRLKILGGMNIAEKRIPQDGRFGFHIDGSALDVRVSSLPTIGGEKVVIRLLSMGDDRVRKVTELGMTGYNAAMFQKILQSPHGMVLVTGPTGSGKTTTLYSALAQLAKPTVNVITVEDPVEKQIEGVNQVQVNTKAGLTFSAGLRSILRQDPDIIMIGEIRDGETAEIAIRAAITGHLVLSTLHTNDAASTIVRLVDMGVAPYLVATSIVGVVAQRLVKLLCPACRQVHLTDETEMQLLGISQPAKIYAAQGCAKCGHSGYRSRTAIHEIIVTSNDIKQLIANQATAEQIAKQARQNGTRLLRDNAAQMVLAGATSMDELIRVTYSV